MQVAFHTVGSDIHKATINTTRNCVSVTINSVFSHLTVLHTPQQHKHKHRHFSFSMATMARERAIRLRCTHTECLALRYNHSGGPILPPKFRLNRICSFNCAPNVCRIHWRRCWRNSHGFVKQLYHPAMWSEDKMRNNKVPVRKSDFRPISETTRSIESMLHLVSMRIITPPPSGKKKPKNYAKYIS